MNHRTIRVLAALLLLMTTLAVAPLASADLDPNAEGAVAAPSGALTGLKAVAVGATHTCALGNDGFVRCWGYNGSGQLGDGSTGSRDLPVTVTGLSNVIQIAVGGAHTCALTGAGAVQCWGDSTEGQIGDGLKISRLAPVQVNGLTAGVKAIAAGSQHTCAVLVDGSVKCWGDNSIGQLGDNSKTDRAAPVTVLGGLTGVSSIAAGSRHTCALTSAGGVKCWGANANGQLGNGQTFERTTPQNVNGLSSGVVDIAAGDGHSCAALADESAKCWGDNLAGQLGNGDQNDQLEPAAVVGLPAGATLVSAGGSFSCARLNNGAVACWGDNQSGQLGDGSGVSHITPGLVSGVSGATDVAAGGAHACTVTAGGTAKCWGENSYGQLADGTMVYRAVRSDLGGLTTAVTELGAGIGHTCALLPNHTVSCWGNNFYGQLGDGTKTQRAMPTLVPGLTGVLELAVGGAHTCARLDTGGIKCWGYNNYGQLGDNSIVDKSTPVDVQNLGIVAIRITAGYAHTCALTSAGGVKCWGRNDEGQIGDGSGFQANTPMNVLGLTVGVNSVTAGGSHTCAVLSNNTAKCWGSNSNGQLGDGATTDAYAPVDVTGLTGVAALAGGGAHTCAHMGDGTAQCWGNNDKGQLGDGSTTQRTTPVPVTGLSNITRLAAGGPHTCAITSDGAVHCWGGNVLGELGDWSLANATAPHIANGAAAGVTSLTLGQSHTCVELIDQTVSCWGWDGSGQLGQGTVTRRLAPVDAQASLAPTLSVNHLNGKPGSTFIVTGHRFTPGQSIQFTLNGEFANLNLSTLPTDSGSFVVFLSTTGNAPGVYVVRAAPSGNPTAGAAVAVRLADNLPLRQATGGSLSISAPGATPLVLKYIYLPLTLR